MDQMEYLQSTPTKTFIFQKQSQPSISTNNSQCIESAGCFLLPHPVPALADKHIQSIACGRSDGHLTFITTDGACFSWGRNEYGELGIEQRESSGRPSSTSVPVAVTLFNPDGCTKITQISVGNCHTAAVAESGELYVWGACWSGQLGLGVAKRHGVHDRRQQLSFPTPTPVDVFGRRKRIAKVSCGAVHTAVITADGGQLYTFGCGDGGRLGLGNNMDALLPTLVTSFERDVVLDVVCCSWHSVALVHLRDCSELDAHEGFVYAFGSGLHGQLGLGKQKIAALPSTFNSPSDA
jgi:alpha-tubulin suppressor-like RCC1 family protein